jgi:hypothetical protein
MHLDVLVLQLRRVVHVGQQRRLDRVAEAFDFRRDADQVSASWGA